MAFGNKGAMDALNESLREQIEFLKTENERLVKQVETLQEAIVSKLAPLAYAEMKADEDIPEDGKSTADLLESWQEEMRVYKDYAAGIEQPSWTDAEDMIDKLSAVVGVSSSANKSIHGNEES